MSRASLWKWVVPFIISGSFLFAQTLDKPVGSDPFSGEWGMVAPAENHELFKPGLVLILNGDRSRDLVDEEAVESARGDSIIPENPSGNNPSLEPREGMIRFLILSDNDLHHPFANCNWTDLEYKTRRMICPDIS